MLTLVSSWYIIPSKFLPTQYYQWINNLLYVHSGGNFNLVIFTNVDSKHIFQKYEHNPRIKIIIREKSNFFTLKKYGIKWIQNHQKNDSVNNKYGWELNMLWCEKIHMVYETIKLKYFNTEWYGWCDIGYFRDILPEDINWPNNDIITILNKQKIYYNEINSDECDCFTDINKLKLIINDKNPETKLPNEEIPFNQISISGGFFLIHPSNIDKWFYLFYNKLDLYFNYDRLIKDDQMLIINCIYDNEYSKHFEIITDNKFNSWFYFRKFLNSVYIRPFVSILMPIFNGIEFIEESINSVKSQTFTNWELIIGINGHEKESKVFQIANKYSSDKIRILDLYQFSTKSSTLNEMINYCNSNWVSLLDVDDIWLNTKLQEQINYIYDYDVIGTNCRYFGDRNDIPFLPLGDLIDFNFSLLNPIINSSCLVKKELCFWNENFTEDYDLWLRLKSQQKKFYNVSKILVLHRIHKTSFFNSK